MRMGPKLDIDIHIDLCSQNSTAPEIKLSNQMTKTYRPIRIVAYVSNVSSNIGLESNAGKCMMRKGGSNEQEISWHCE